MKNKKTMSKTPTYPVIAIAALLFFAGCATSREVAPINNAPTVQHASSSRSLSSNKEEPPQKSAGNKAAKSSAHKENCARLGVTPDSSDNARLYSESAAWLGARYQYGGNSKSGIDCSGFVYAVYKAVYGHELTRQSARMLTDNCTRINKSQLREGDLVFFRTDGKQSTTPNHVGIYLKENKFIHASTSKGVVVSDLTSAYYVSKWITGGRVVR